MKKEEILELINFNKKSEPEELFRIYKDCYILIIKIFLHLGFKDNLYKEPLYLLKDYINIIKKETIIYDNIIIYLDQLDLELINNILADIEDLHIEAYTRLDKDLKDMEDALDINDSNRIKRSKYNDLSTRINEYLPYLNIPSKKFHS